MIKKLSAVVGALALVGSLSAPAMAATMTFNPKAANGDLSNKQIDSLRGAFSATSIQTSLSSVLKINADGDGQDAGWTESGHLIVTGYNNGSARNANRTFDSAGDGRYDIYATFLGSGTGDWIGNQFTVDAISSFVIKLWASPSSGTALGLATAASSTDTTGGITAGSKDFLLGTATFAGSFGGTNAQLGSDNKASTQLTASFNFTPASSDYVGTGGGKDGYFQAPDPFNLVLSASGSTNINQSGYVGSPPGDVVITTAAFNAAGDPNGATGNITANVPEPGGLALVGLALAGLALFNRRKV